MKRHRKNGIANRQIRKALRLHKKGKLSQRQIAKEVGVSPASAYHIIRLGSVKAYRNRYKEETK